VETDAEAPDYILNVNTKKFHYPHCSSVEDMKESNKQPFSGDREEVLAQGYKACMLKQAMDHYYERKYAQHE